MITIDKGYPVPRLSGRAKEEYPLVRMEPGDSFFAGKDDKSELARVRQAISRLGPDYKGLFTVRKTPDGHRCWRLSAEPR